MKKCPSFFLENCPRCHPWIKSNESACLNHTTITIYSYLILGAGDRGALSIVLRMYENDFDYICRGSIIGFKVAIHLTGDLPSILSSNHFVRVPINQETLITFQPEVMRTADSLQRYSPTDRGCYYSNEGTLKYFKEYTQRNCELECLTDHTLNNCGCVKFSMPSKIFRRMCWKFPCIKCIILFSNKT